MGIRCGGLLCPTCLDEVPASQEIAYNEAIQSLQAELAKLKCPHSPEPTADGGMDSSLQMAAEMRKTADTLEAQYLQDENPEWLEIAKGNRAIADELDAQACAIGALRKEVNGVRQKLAKAKAEVLSLREHITIVEPTAEKFIAESKHNRAIGLMLHDASQQATKWRGQRDCLARMLKAIDPEKFRGRADIPGHVVSVAIDVLDQISKEKEDTDG